jgi:hypothetical protein
MNQAQDERLKANAAVLPCVLRLVPLTYFSGILHHDFGEFCGEILGL